MLAGSVAEFDGGKGLGVIVDDGGTRFAFHCIEIADGTRTIEVGAAVVFQPLPKFGHFQAGAIRKV